MKACLSRSLYCNYDTGKYHSFTIFLTSRKYDSAFQDLIIDESIDQEFIGRLIDWLCIIKFSVCVALCVTLLQ